MYMHKMVDAISIAYIGTYFVVELNISRSVGRLVGWLLGWLVAWCMYVDGRTDGRMDRCRGPGARMRWEITY